MKKIMFNDRFLLTQAVLEGRKRQTRRFVPKEVFSLIWDVEETFESPKIIYTQDLYGDFWDIRDTSFAQYKKGEIVAIAQRYSDIYRLLYNCETYKRNLPAGMSVADFRKEFEGEKGWNNKMFVKPKYMPRRIEITDVRTQCLQEITDDECLLEGIQEASIGFYVDGLKVRNWQKEPHRETERGCMKLFPTPRDAYARLIDALSGKGTWGSNPYVFVYDFELI